METILSIHKPSLGLTQNLGQIGSVVLTFIGYKQTDRLDKQSINKDIEDEIYLFFWISLKILFLGFVALSLINTGSRNIEKNLIAINNLCPARL